MSLITWSWIFLVFYVGGMLVIGGVLLGQGPAEAFARLTDL